MKDKLMNNTGMKILSVVVAFLIWLLVANTNDPVVSKRFSDIPVKVINESVLTSEGFAYEIIEGEAVTITVRGKNSIVGGLRDSDFQAVADFSKLSKVDAVPIDVSVRKYEDQLELSLGNINTMKIREEKITSISVPVNVKVEGDAIAGYAIGKTTGTPNLVKVTGPDNLLKTIKEIRAEVRVHDIADKVTTTVKPIIYDEDENIVDNSQIEMDTGSISVTIEVWKTKTVDVNLDTTGKPAAGYSLVSFDYEPKSIVVAAPGDVLAGLDGIYLDPISLDGMKEDYEVDLDAASLVTDENVIVVNQTTDIKAKATIEKVISKDLVFSSNDIKVRGAGDRKLNYDSSNNYSMTIEGATSTVNRLKINDFEPWINVEGLEDGEHELTVHVKEVEGATVEKTAKIKVILGD